MKRADFGAGVTVGGATADVAAHGTQARTRRRVLRPRPGPCRRTRRKRTTSARSVPRHCPELLACQHEQLRLIAQHTHIHSTIGGNINQGQLTWPPRLTHRSASSRATSRSATASTRASRRRWRRRRRAVPTRRATARPSSAPAAASPHPARTSRLGTFHTTLMAALRRSLHVLARACEAPRTRLVPHVFKVALNCAGLIFPCKLFHDLARGCDEASAPSASNGAK